MTTSGARRTTSCRARRGAALLTLSAAVLAGQAALPAAAAAGPTAVDDETYALAASTVRLAGATNDRAGSAALRPDLTVFPVDGQPAGVVVSDAGKTLKSARHGTFAVAGDGSITFQGWVGLTGTVSVHYRITDAAGATDDGTVTVVVGAGGVHDYTLADYGTEYAVTDLLANDLPGRNADGTPGTLDRTSVRFAQEQIWGAVVTDDGHTATVPHLGVATLDDQGLMTWRADPSTSYWGNSADVYYTTRDTTR